VLDDRNVSRRHARLELVDGALVVIDLGSANGTLVNGNRVGKHQLAPQDKLVIGRFEVNWTFVDPDVTSRINPADMTVFRPSGPRTVPARKVVEAAEAHNRRVGHELDGFLSVAQGFLPLETPLQAFPESHRAWDDMVDRLPDLFRRLMLRRAFDQMPVLDARPEALPDRYLLRASTLLGVFAHAYQYMAIDPPRALPESLLRPWTTVSRRLGKQMPAVSYIDLFLYNWRLRDPAGPRRLDNMDLLVPTWNNAAERVFYLVTTEFAMGLTPVLGAMLNAQEAVVADDPAGLEAALLIIHDRLHHVTQAIYPQIDPNPLGRNGIDQVLWAKTVGTAGVPIFDGAPSPSGTAQPQIHALDAFLERKDFASLVGQQSVYLGGFFPRHWQELVVALRKVSVRQYVEDTRSATLRGVYNAMLEAYVGDRGWMGLHRIKAYGFLEVAFKVGRQVTTGARFTGLFKDKTWDKVDGELAIVREERRPPVGQPVVFGTPRTGRVVTDPVTGAWTCYAEIDVSGQGVHHLPGDRVGVLAENDDELVRRTVAALQATGDELVGLTPTWQAALRRRAGYSADVEVLPLSTLLKFARLRPVDRELAKRLLDLSAVGALRRVVDARMEDQWELWDLLNLLHAGGYDVTRLWKADPREPDALCAVLPAERFRLYSIASAAPSGEAAQTLRLIVGGLRYTSARSPWSYPRERRGSASHFLRRVTSAPRGAKLSLQVVPTPRFRLPADPARPVVMFAAGSGIAPFHGFVAARTGPGENRLYLGVRTPAEFVEHTDLDAAAAQGRLALSVAFSRADAAVAFDGTAHVVEPGKRRRVDDLIRTEEHATGLWELLRPVAEGGRGGHVYVCGSARFAASVMTALTDVVRRGTGSAAAARDFVRRLVAEGRLGQDVFTTYLGHAQQGPTFEVSDLATRNTPEAGFWMAVGGAVYDVSEFLYLHVGGPHIVRNHVGLDATAAYRQVLHHVHAEVDAQLAMYELGHLRRLQFEGRWGIVLTEDGLRSLPLDELFAAWVRFIYLVVGMENALAADFGFTTMTATRGEDPRELTPFKAQYVVEGHRRFLVSYLDGLLDDDLRNLWQLTVGFCDPEVDVRSYDADLSRLAGMSDYVLVRGSVATVKEVLRSGEEPGRVAGLCRTYMHADAQVLREVKHALLGGIRAFEQHEADVVELAGADLLTALRGAVDAVSLYYRRLADHTRGHGIAAADNPVVEPIPPDRGLPGHGGPLG
jgi:sulfite reductase alpha subunit-like flavoprotein